MTDLSLKTAALAPIVAEILLCRSRGFGTAQKIGADSGNSFLLKLNSKFYPEASGPNSNLRMFLPKFRDTKLDKNALNIL